MSTPRDLIATSLRLIGVLAAGETPQASEATDGLSALNRMLDTWSIENLMIPAVVAESFPLSGGQQTYTLGPSGNFNTSRPVQLFRAGIKPSGSTNVELPLRILTVEQWAEITSKDTTSTIPQAVYADGASPLTNVSFWPIPADSSTVVFYTDKPLAQIATLDSAITLYPGYEEAITTNLAVRIAPEYGRQVPEQVIALSISSIAGIKRKNERPRYLKVDPALMSHRYGFNITTGDTT